MDGFHQMYKGLQVLQQISGSNALNELPDNEFDFPDTAANPNTTLPETTIVGKKPLVYDAKVEAAQTFLNQEFQSGLNPYGLLGNHTKQVLDLYKEERNIPQNYSDSDVIDVIFNELQAKRNNYKNDELDS